MILLALMAAIALAFVLVLAASDDFGSEEAIARNGAQRDLRHQGPPNRRHERRPTGSLHDGAGPG